MNTARVLAGVAVAATIALLGTACSNQPVDPTQALPTNLLPGVGASTPDPCDLLTVEEVTAALGVQFTVATELPAGGMPGQRTCSYATTDALGTVNVGVWPFAPAGLEAFQEAAGDVSGYDGIGDVAFGEPRSMWALEGSLMVNVVIVGIELPAEDGVEPIDPILALTRDAVSRLP